jgi:hypothetical protein
LALAELGLAPPVAVAKAWALAWAMLRGTHWGLRVPALEEAIALARACAAAPAPPA